MSDFTTRVIAKIETDMTLFDRAINLAEDRIETLGKRQEVANKEIARATNKLTRAQEALNTASANEIITIEKRKEAVAALEKAEKRLSKIRRPDNDLIPILKEQIESLEAEIQDLNEDLEVLAKVQIRAKNATEQATLAIQRQEIIIESAGNTIKSNELTADRAANSRVAAELRKEATLTRVNNKIIAEGKALADSTVKLSKEIIRNIEKEAAARKKLADEIVAQTNRANASVLQSMERQMGMIGRLRTSLRSVGNIATHAGMAITTAFSAPMAFAGREIIQYQDKVFRAGLAFEVLTKSASVARRTIADIERLAATTPFSFEDLLPNVQKLMAVGMSSNGAVKAVRDIANGIAAIGGSKDGIDQLTYAFQRLGAEGKVSRLIFRAFYAAGVNINKVLGDAFKVTTQQMSKMISDGVVPASKAIPILLDYLANRAPGLLEKSTRSIAGMASNIKDFALQFSRVTFSPLYEGLVNAFDKIQKKLLTLRKEAEDWDDTFKSKIIAGFAAIASFGPALLALGIAVRIVAAFTSPITLLAAAFAGMVYTLSQNKDMLAQLQQIGLENKQLFIDLATSVGQLSVTLGEMMVEIVRPLIPLLVGLAKAIKWVADSLNQMNPSLLQFIVVGGTTLTLITKLRTAMLLYAATYPGLIRSIAFLVLGEKTVTAAIIAKTGATAADTTAAIANNAATIKQSSLLTILASRLGLYGLAVYGLYQYIEMLTNSQKEANNLGYVINGQIIAQNEATRKLTWNKMQEGQEVGRLAIAYTKLKSNLSLTEKGKADLKKITDKLLELEPSILRGLDEQGKAGREAAKKVEELATAYINVAKAAYISQQQTQEGLAISFQEDKAVFKAIADEIKNIKGQVLEGLTKDVFGDANLANKWFTIIQSLKESFPQAKILDYFGPRIAGILNTSKTMEEAIKRLTKEEKDLQLGIESTNKLAKEATSKAKEYAKGFHREISGKRFADVPPINPVNSGTPAGGGTVSVVPEKENKELEKWKSLIEQLISKKQDLAKEIKYGTAITRLETFEWEKQNFTITAAGELINNEVNNTIAASKDRKNTILEIQKDIEDLTKKLTSSSIARRMNDEKEVRAMSPKTKALVDFIGGLKEYKTLVKELSASQLKDMSNKIFGFLKADELEKYTASMKELKNNLKEVFGGKSSLPKTFTQLTKGQLADEDNLKNAIKFAEELVKKQDDLIKQISKKENNTYSGQFESWLEAALDGIDKKILELDPNFDKLISKIRRFTQGEDAKKFKEWFTNIQATLLGKSTTGTSDATRSSFLDDWRNFVKENGQGMASGGLGGIILGIRTFAEYWKSIPESMTKVSKLIKKTFDKDTLNLIQEFTKGTADIFANMFYDIQENKFKNMFNYIYTGFKQLLFKMSVEWLKSQLYLKMIDLLGGAFGFSSADMKSSPGGSSGGGGSNVFDALRPSSSIFNSSNLSNVSSIANTSASNGVTNATYRSYSSNSINNIASNVRSYSSAMSRSINNMLGISSSVPAMAGIILGSGGSSSSYAPSVSRNTGDVYSTNSSSYNTAGGRTIVVNQTFNIAATDVNSFRRAKGAILEESRQVMEKAARSLR